MPAAPTVVVVVVEEESVVVDIMSKDRFVAVVAPSSSNDVVLA